MTRIEEILGEAQERLNVARVGLSVAKGGPYGVNAGFRNLTVYGKMVTFCTNNLRGKVEGFEEWDREAKKRHFDNSVAVAMSDARNQFEKQAKNPVFSSSHIKLFDGARLEALPKPDNAVAFFMGDRVGGSGWMVQMENGDQVPFYIDLPVEIGAASAVIGTVDGTADLLSSAEQYLNALQLYVDELKEFCSGRDS